MKTASVTELKARLSKYLRLVGRGERIFVTDRGEPVAQLGPVEGAAVSWRDRMAREGRLRLGSQDWANRRSSRLARRTDIQTSLKAVREDPSEIRGR